ncbi:MAG: VWA domain-containing protein [Clostridiales bacterium]|nr:VWA domain-containing protein [Clostridiales bacterium]
MKRILAVLAAVLFLTAAAGTLLTGCAGGESFVILSGSENEALEPILDAFGRQNHVKIEMVYKGSVDIMNLLGTSTIKQYDAVWPANSIWINMGDRNHIVKNAQSIMRSPIVFGIRKSLAEELGFTSGDVYVRDILREIRGGRLRFMMTSATQSNSGACAYIGFLNALLDNPDEITLEDLQDATLQKDVKDLLSGVNRSSGSSGWLKKLFLAGDYDAMVNYESMIIEANQELVAEGREPLYLVYPVDGLAIADSPLGMIDKGDERSAAVFQKLTDYLLGDEAQQELMNLGRRTGFGGSIEGADPKVFNPDWGIDSARTLSGIRMPDSDVIMAALELYQSELKKPAYTIYCLDFSGSMSGGGERQLKQAMALILTQSQAEQYLLQANRDDVTIVIPFSSYPWDQLRVDGSDDNELYLLANQIAGLSPLGGTDIYSPAIQALDLLQSVDTDRYFCAVVLLTDGESNTGASYRDFAKAYEALDKDIPLFAIMLGNASESQLQPLADLTRGSVFESDGDLVSAFKKVKGYN